MTRTEWKEKVLFVLRKIKTTKDVKEKRALRKEFIFLMDSEPARKEEPT